MRRLLAVALLAFAGAAALAPAAEPERKWPAGAALMSTLTPGLLQTAEETVFFLRIGADLALGESQHAALLQIAYEFEKQRLQKIADMNVADAELDRLLTRDAIDLEAVRAKVRESAAIAAAMKMVQIESLLRAVKILTHEQHLKVILLRRMAKESGS